MTEPVYCAICEHTHADVPGLVLARWRDQDICTDCLENRPGREEAEAEARGVPTYDEWVAWAKEEYVNEDINIDSDTKLAHTEYNLGCWVQAWVWVSNRYVDEG
jgi:hypothetical protein